MTNATALNNRMRLIEATSANEGRD
jgi:hypothetical protein